MGLTMGRRQALTKAIATRYRQAGRADKSTILDELCQVRELVATQQRFGELDVGDEVAAAGVAMSPATMDRRLVEARAAMRLRGRSHTKPGSLLKDAIAIRTWAQWDGAVPGFVEIDLVGHEGGNAAGEHAYTLTVTDIATGWRENRSVPNK